MKIEEIKKALKPILIEKDEIIASYLYGSFLYSEFYEDIDIGILIQKEFIPNTLYEVKLAGKLDKVLRPICNPFKQVDVCVFNNKPLRFLYSVLKNSKIIYSKNDLKRVHFEANVIKEYLDIKPHFENYDKMRSLRYVNR